MINTATLMQIEAVVFDMDGTLVDSEGLYCDACRYTMEKHGGALTEADYYARFAGQSEDVADDLMHADLNGQVERASLRTIRFQEFARLRNRRGVPVLPGVLDLLGQFERRDLPMGVASAAELHDIEESLLLAGIRHRFRVVASSEEVPATKPSPDVYLLAAERLGIRADCCLAFEDTNAGARAAIAAGMITYMVPHRCEPDRFVMKHARGIAKSLAEIAQALA